MSKRTAPCLPLVAVLGLLVAVNGATGSGGHRDGATDGRTVQQVLPYTLLRLGMKDDDVWKLLGRCSASFHSFTGDTCLWTFPGDEWGKCVDVWVTLQDGRVTGWKVSAPK